MSSDFFEHGSVYAMKSSTKNFKYVIREVLENYRPVVEHEDLTAIAHQIHPDGKERVVLLSRKSFEKMEEI
jgi:hypothetical protein